MLVVQNALKISTVILQKCNHRDPRLTRRLMLFHPGSFSPQLCANKYPVILVVCPNALAYLRVYVTVLVTASKSLNLMSRIPPHLVAHYLRLGLAPSATRAQITEAYRAAALKHHPDRGGCGPTFAAITDSYHAILNNTAHPYGFRPASLRSYVDRNSAYTLSSEPLGKVLTALLIPTFIGVFFGVRYVFFGREREGLRAGGTSRYVPPTGHASSS